MAEIFKAYDIRGVYPKELNEDTAYKIGRAFVDFFCVKSAVIGRDGRSSSPKIFEALAKGITEQGADVIDIGLCSTPMFYFGSRDAEASIMVTASHNPKEYNGFKLCGEKAFPISEENGIKDVKRIVESNKFKKAERKGKIIKKDIMADYVKHNLRFLKTKNKFKIVLDAGNGMCGYTFPKILENVKNIELVKLYCNIDFSFPNHEPNPLKFETLHDIQKRVVKEKADLGIATDGDGDRCVFIDEKGEIISSDLATALIAEEMLKDHHGATILYDLRSSKIVKEVIEKNGGKAVMCRVGHSFIKKQMREEKSLFAGELSGHMYYRDNNYTESTFISLAEILNLISEKNKPLSELVKPLKKYSASGEINSEVKDKDAKLLEIEKMYKDKAIEILHLDGLSMYFKGWWFNLRKSNTEPLLRLNLEADTRKMMEEERDEVLRLINS